MYYSLIPKTTTIKMLLENEFRKKSRYLSTVYINRKAETFNPEKNLYASEY